MIPAVLVVEDEVDQRRAVAALLAALFPVARVVATDSGETAFALARRSRPHVVLLDLHLRGIDGFAFVEALHDLPDGRAVPIVALTGDDSPATLVRAEAAGFAAVLHKPANPDRMERVLRPFLEASSSSPEVSPSKR